MKDLYHAIDALNNIVNEEPPRGRQDGPGTRQGTPQTPKPAAPKPAAATPRPAAVSPAPGVGRQDGPGLPKPAAPKINPAVPAAGPVRANPIDPQAMAATKAAASVINAPKPAVQAPTPAAVPVPKPKPAEPVAAPKPQGGERVTYQSLAKASGIADPNKIRPGQEIKLPGGGTYKVQSGDTLSGIAQNYRLKKIGQPKSGKLDDPTTKLPQITKPEPGKELGDFEIAPNTDAGDDTDDRLNKYAFLQRGDYKLDPSSVKQPPKKAPGKSLYNQFTDWAKGTKWYDMATSNPEPKITNVKGEK